MKTTSISALKARLSAVLRTVVGGREVVITDRGRPIARLVPMRSSPDNLRDLVERGVVRVARHRLPRGFFDRARPRDPEGALRGAVAEEREAGY